MSSLLELIRFGYGPARGQVVQAGGIDPDRLLAQLGAPDPAAQRWDRPTLADRYALLAERAEERRNGAPEVSASERMKEIVAQDRISFTVRPAVADLGFVERLVNLFANRLTVASTAGAGNYVQPFRDEAVRPHIGGRFADMLRSALWHPAMHFYLNQTTSVGPMSSMGLRKGKGLNENLAREFLELHSMGTGYTQTDVTELARLLAGMVQDAKGLRMDTRSIEPGEKIILGQRYGDADPMAEITRLVEDVARRPETAQSVGRMLARHFIADDPAADLVDHIARAYSRSDGWLPDTYRALLEQGAAQDPVRQKLRSPQEFVAATLRAMGMTGLETGLPGLHKNRDFAVPDLLARMGQPVFRARRPDGWPETAPGWMTPPMMAARLDWATDLSRIAGKKADPGAVADAALGDLATPMLHRAVRGAEQRWEGLAVLFGSPDFMRR